MNKIIKVLVICILIVVLTTQILSLFKKSREMLLIAAYTIMYQNDKEYIIASFNAINEYLEVTNQMHRRVLAIDRYLADNYNDYILEVKHSIAMLDSLAFINQSMGIDSLDSIKGGEEQ